MSFATTLLSIVPIRKSPAEESEMISQLLFGETCTIVSSNEAWFEIKTSFDAYTGWVDKRMVMLSDTNMPKIQTRHIVKKPLLYITHNKSKAGQWVTAGSELHKFSPDFSAFSIGDHTYHTHDYLITDYNIPVRENLINTAKGYINVPYLWGGKTVFGIDCSGFVQMVYKIHNIALPRDSRYQYKTAGPEISIRDALPGDIAFFSKKGGQISHVGILLNKDKIIHASGYVRIDRLDLKGIFNEELKEYTHELIAIKKIL